MATIHYADLPAEATAILPVYLVGIGTNVKQESFSRPALGHPQLILTRSGAGTACIGKKRYSLRTDVLLLVDGDVPCTIEATEQPWIIDWVSFDYGYPLLYDQLFQDDRKTVCGVSSAADKLHESFTALALALERDARFGKYTASAHLYRLLVNMYLAASFGFETDRTGAAVLDQACAYISEHDTENIRLEDLCEAAGGVSKQYLCRVFKKNTGLRPIEFIMRRRIATVRAMLERSDAPIAEIAEAVGFHNTSYFYRNFKKFTGVSPNAYRQAAEDADL